MERREFKEFIAQGVQTKLFAMAVIIRTLGFALGIISGILSVPDRLNPVGTIIGLLLGNGFTLFLIILPLYEILRAKNSLNFKESCDFGLKYIRINTIMLVVFSVLLVIVSLLAMVVVDFKMIFVLALSAVVLVHSILQLEIINDLRNGLFYNIEKISHALLYLVLTVLLCVMSVINETVNGRYFEVAIQLVNSLSQIIFAYLVFTANEKYTKHLLK